MRASSRKFRVSHRTFCAGAKLLPRSDETFFSHSRLRSDTTWGAGTRDTRVTRGKLTRGNMGTRITQTNLTATHPNPPITHPQRLITVRGVCTPTAAPRAAGKSYFVNYFVALGQTHAPTVHTYFHFHQKNQLNMCCCSKEPLASKSRYGDRANSPLRRRLRRRSRAG